MSVTAGLIDTGRPVALLPGIGYHHALHPIIPHEQYLPPLLDLQVPARLIAYGPEVHPATPGVFPGNPRVVEPAITVLLRTQSEHGLLPFHPEGDVALHIFDTGAAAHLGQHYIAIVEPHRHFSGPQAGDELIARPAVTRTLVYQGPAHGTRILVPVLHRFPTLHGMPAASRQVWQQ